MKRIVTALLMAVAMTAPALAKDRLVHLTLDGRPVDREGGIAVLHDGVVYADVRDLVKAFSGLLTFQGKKVVVSLGSHTGTFTIGSRTLLIDQGAATMRGDVFTRNRDVYVPLDAFVRQLAHGRVSYDASRTHADIAVNTSTEVH